jgi:hypothetical protein
MEYTEASSPWQGEGGRPARRPPSFILSSHELGQRDEAVSPLHHPRVTSVSRSFSEGSDLRRRHHHHRA